jgi:hypothetical protein
LYEIQQQQQQQNFNFKLLQTFPQEHSDHYISSLIQLNPRTLISSSYSELSYCETDSAIVVWSKSKSKPQTYKPIQRITNKIAGSKNAIDRLVLLNQKKDEEEFASCSYLDDSVIIWQRGKGQKEREFKIKQRIRNETYVQRMLYISLTNELIFCSSCLLQIWSPSPSPSSSSSSDFVEKQKIEAYPFSICSLCQITENKNDSKIEFASSHMNGQIMIWSKPHENGSNYTLSKTLQAFEEWISDVIFLNDNECNLLISSCYRENKIIIFKEEDEREEELKHEKVGKLIPMSNGRFASGGDNGILNIWSPSSSSSSSSS